MVEPKRRVSGIRRQGGESRDVPPHKHDDFSKVSGRLIFGGGTDREVVIEELAALWSADDPAATAMERIERHWWECSPQWAHLSKLLPCPHCHDLRKAILGLLSAYGLVSQAVSAGFFGSPGNTERLELIKAALLERGERLVDGCRSLLVARYVDAGIAQRPMPELSCDSDQALRLKQNTQSLLTFITQEIRDDATCRVRVLDLEDVRALFGDARPRSIDPAQSATRPFLARDGSFFILADGTLGRYEQGLTADGTRRAFLKALVELGGKQEAKPIWARVDSANRAQLPGLRATPRPAGNLWKKEAIVGPILCIEKRRNGQSPLFSIADSVELVLERPR